MVQKLSEVVDEELKNTPLMFIKTFASKEYKESFLRGEIFCNTFDYFVKEEEKHGKGRGDGFEGINVMSNVDLEFHSKSKSDPMIFKASVGKFGLKSKVNDTEKMHLFCVTGVFPSWFNIEKQIDESTFECSLCIPDNFIEEVRSSFGSEVAFFPQYEFIEALEEYGNKNNQHIEHGKVKYLDYSTNPKERIEAYFTNSINFYFQKDIYFKNQDEYRFVFPGILSEKPEVIVLDRKINALENISTVQDLLNNPVKMTLRFEKNS